MDDQIYCASGSNPKGILQARRNRAGGIVFLGVMAATAAAAAYLWINHDRSAEAAISVTGSTTVRVVDRAEETLSLDETASLKEFQQFQQRSREALESANQDIAAQKADLKSLSDQVKSLSDHVLALATGMDALKSAAVPAPPQPAIPERPQGIAARKKPAPKTTGPISVGGAPLPLASPDPPRRE